MKRYRFLIVGTILIFAQLKLMASNAASSLEYKVTINEPHTHYFDVEIILKNPHGKFVDFKLPVWTPGSYLIREYSGNVQGFQAYLLEGETSLDFAKQNKSTWRIELTSGKDIGIRYRVYAFGGSTRMSYLDEEHAFIMANTLLMYVDELRSSSSILKLEYPDEWKSLSTSLSNIEGSENVFYIPDYDILVDSPLEIGNHEIINFNACGVDHSVAMVGTVKFDREQLVRDLTQIVGSATSIFQENPNEHYTFIIHTDKRSGALEHANSTVLGLDRWSFTDQNKYLDFLSVAAHEYFHLWMVKRLKPVELQEIDYEKEMYTDMLWVMEGFTEYYDKKILLNCGFYTPQKFINTLLKTMSDLENLPGTQVQSVADASFDAWIKYYRKNENSVNTQVSYYAKGMVLAALLDLQIISASAGTNSLDNVINQLYYQYYKKANKGIVCEDLKRACERAANVDLTDFFNDHVFGTKPIDNAKFLDLAGIELIETNGNVNHKALGISCTDKGGSLYISAVHRGGPAYKHGLNTGDELIAINDYRIDKSNYQLILNSFADGDLVRVLVARQGLMVEKELTIRLDDSVNYTYELQKDRSKLQIKTYTAWIGN